MKIESADLEDCKKNINCAVYQNPYKVIAFEFFLLFHLYPIFDIPKINKFIQEFIGFSMVGWYFAIAQDSTIARPIRDKIICYIFSTLHLFFAVKA